MMHRIFRLCKFEFSMRIMLLSALSLILCLIVPTVLSETNIKTNQLTLNIISKQPILNECITDGRLKIITTRIHVVNSTLADIDAMYIAEAILRESYNLNVDWRCILSTIHQESHFNYAAINHKTNCWGLMQVRPNDMSGRDVWFKTLYKYGLLSCKEDLLDIDTNIRCGTFILRLYLNKHNTVKKALNRYGGVIHNTGYAESVIAKIKQVNNI